MKIIPQRKYTKANDPGASKQRGGRPADVDPYIFHSVGLTRSQWEFIALWFPSGNPSSALRSLLDRAVKFWPGGPFVFRGGAL
jgi:hypothetical protein